MAGSGYTIYTEAVLVHQADSDLSHPVTLVSQGAERVFAESQARMDYRHSPLVEKSATGRFE